jgi:hypothetical protein
MSDQGDGPQPSEADPAFSMPTTDLQPVRFEISAGYSPSAQLQPGSRFSLAPIPSGLEFEEVNRPEGVMICYTMHTVIGAFRFLFPLDAVKFHHAKLGEIVSKPRPIIATAMPPEPPFGQNRQQRRHP